MQHVELDGGHRVEVALDYIHRLKVTARIYHQTAPLKARLVLNARSRDEVSVAITFKELQKSFKPAKRSDYCVGLKDSLRIRYIERVGFILINRRHALASTVALD